MKLKWFDLLRTGKFKTVKGEDVEITEKDLTDIEANYKPDEFAAPMTLGHPKDQKEPAYGWISAVKKFGDKLCFTPGKVVKEFAEAVNKGMFPRVSAGVENADNGTKALNHVAFLGAWKPAVSGLAKIEGMNFASQKDSLCLEFADWNSEKLEFAVADNDLNYKFETIGELISNMRDFIIDKYDMDTADSVLQSWQIDQIKKKLTENETAMTNNFAGNQENIDGGVQGVETQCIASLQSSNTTTETEQLKNEIKEFATKLETETELKNEALFKAAEMESKAKDAVTERARFEFAAWADDMVGQNKLYPQDKNSTINKLIYFASENIAEFASDFNNTDVIQFKQRIEKNESTDLTKEIAKNGKGEKPEVSSIELAGFAGEHIAEMAAKGQRVSAAAAVEFVQNNIEKFRG